METSLPGTCLLSGCDLQWSLVRSEGRYFGCQQSDHSWREEAGHRRAFVLL